MKPGNRLSLEYGVSHYVTAWLELGIQGAHNWQVTDDTGSDVFWDPSYHDRKSTLLVQRGVLAVGRAAVCGREVRLRLRGSAAL